MNVIKYMNKKTRKNTRSLTAVLRPLTLIILYSLFTNPTEAQTSTGPYFPGATAEGAVYFLPKTAIRVAVKIEKSVYTPGEFATYAERFLRLNGVGTEPSTVYRILSVTQTAIGVRDTAKAYVVKFNNKTAAINVAQTEDGVLLAVNGEGSPQVIPTPFQAAPKPAPVNPRLFLNEEIAAAGSVAKMAELTAQEIFDIRDSRSQLIKGQADFMPKDGEQLRLMLQQLDVQDRALTSMFAGTTVRDTTEEVIIVTPERELQSETLFRFSKHFGLVDSDDMSGSPYTISIKNLSQSPATDEGAARRKRKAENGLYYNVPGVIRSTLHHGNDIISEEEYPAGQFGSVELLSGDLFNKHFGTRLWLNPLTGGIEKIEAEQPK